ncbi:MAG TPA: methyltransferase domain-containing protein [Rhizomicrobium sp.]|nr:methyltransferase domain-containing protein [Rhizomicrobium sp.]
MTDARPALFDFKAVDMRRQRARRIGGDVFLEQAAAEGVLERLSTVKRRFKTAMALDVGERAFPIIEKSADGWAFATLGERESVPLKNEKFDLIVSVLALQAVNDLPGVLVQIRRALNPDGLFLAALFGGATLTELRESFAAAEIQTRGGISPRVSPFADVRDMGGLLQRAGFALAVADVERLTARYGDFSALGCDLRAHGLTNVLRDRSRKFLRRDTLAALKAHYRAHHAAWEKLNATFEIIFLTGWAPDASQQQPLKPGSARTRLAEALGTVEHKAD